VLPIGDTYTEAPFIAGAFLVSATPPIGKLPGWGTGDGSGGCGSPTHGPSGSSLGTPNLAWNYGTWLPGFLGSTI